jgi:hypothetical protein
MWIAASDLHTLICLIGTHSNDFLIFLLLVSFHLFALQRVGQIKTMNSGRRDVGQDRRVKSVEQLEEVRQRQEGKTTTELLRQACRDANASVDVGHDTNKKLGKQGEQMDSMSNTLDTIDYELKVSDRIVKSMSSWGGMVAAWFTSAPKAPKEKPSTPEKIETGRKSSSAREKTSSSRTSQKPNEASKLEKSDVVKAQQQQSTPRDEEDDLLESLHNDLKTMKHQATTQREVISEQNRKLDDLSNKNDAVMQKMKSTDRKVRHMLNN